MRERLRLENRVVVVTGAASGIGRALASELAAAGSRLALADVDRAGLEETARLAGARVGLLAAVVEAVRRRRARVLIGADARLLDVVQRALPARYGAVIGAVLARAGDRLTRRAAPAPRAACPSSS